MWLGINIMLAITTLLCWFKAYKAGDKTPCNSDGSFFVWLAIAFASSCAFIISTVICMFLGGA